jgi:thymidylate synthase ThyX
MLEFIPCTIKYSKVSMGVSQLFGFRDKKNYYTNVRELLNWGYTLDEVLKCVDFTNYVVFKCEAPYFIYGQISTHTQLTTVSHSQRYAECDRGFWKPSEVTSMSQSQWDKGVLKWRPNELKQVMIKSGITRKEVFDRGVDMLQNRVFVIGGYTNNPNSWGHFIAQRLDTHTQKETREFVKLFEL